MEVINTNGNVIIKRVVHVRAGHKMFPQLKLIRRLNYRQFQEDVLQTRTIPLGDKIAWPIRQLGGVFANLTNIPHRSEQWYLRLIYSRISSYSVKVEIELSAEKIVWGFSEAGDSGSVLTPNRRRVLADMEAEIQALNSC